VSEILLRVGTNADVPFITNSWLKSYRSADFVRAMPDQQYYHFQHKLLEELLPESVVKVACNAERNDQILGWICAQPTTEALIVHFVYVKQPFRGLGVARRLVTELLNDYGLTEIVFTHRTKLFWPARRVGKEEPEESFVQKANRWRLIYNPFMAFKGLYGTQAQV